MKKRETKTELVEVEVDISTENLRFVTWLGDKCGLSATDVASLLVVLKCYSDGILKYPRRRRRCRHNDVPK